MSNARELSQLPSQTGRKNLLYNGQMQVVQRGTSFTGVTTAQYTLDRWEWASLNAETVTIEQASDHPSGVGQSLKFTVTTADASPTGYTVFHQKLEGADVQNLRYGSANAKSVTVSFWVKASVTGDYSVNLYTITATAQIIGSVITVNSANTWEYKTVTFVGDTATVIPNVVSEGLRLTIGLAANATYNDTDNTSWGAYSAGKFLYGQTANLVGTTSATFQMTDVQMEVGSVATEFEYRSYGEELALCQRYYQDQDQQSIMSSYVSAGSYHYASHDLPMQMRTGPSITITYLGAGGSLGSATAPTVQGTSISGTGFYVYKASISAGMGYTIYRYTTDAEL
jgi:hypothetical protein